MNKETKLLRLRRRSLLLESRWQSVGAVVPRVGKTLVGLGFARKLYCGYKGVRSETAWESHRFSKFMISSIFIKVLEKRLGTS